MLGGKCTTVSSAFCSYTPGFPILFLKIDLARPHTTLRCCQCRDSLVGVITRRAGELEDA
jgi:hypothetical protein